MKKNHRHYILLITALATLFLAATVYLLLYREVITQARESAIAKAEVISENNKKLHERELTATYADSLSDRSKLTSFLVSEEKIVEFIESVEKIGEYSGSNVELSGISTSDTATKSEAGFGHISASLNISGPWPNVMRALILLENMPYSMTMNNLVLVASNQTSKVREWELSLAIRVLTRK